MPDFIRICPKCSHLNTEYATRCAACQQFLGMEEAVARDSIPSTDDVDVPSPTEVPARTTGRACFIEPVGSDQMYVVQSGWVLGQAHDSSQAEVQIEGVTGIEQVHRQHCRFERVQGQWFVTAIDQRAQGREFTNPTWVNQHNLLPNQQHPLHNGDQLRLSGVVLQVHLL